MPTTTVIIIDRTTGEPIENERVSLIFPWGGCSEDVWTDYDGEAIIKHSSTGEADLYLNGNYVGSVMTPGVIKKYKRTS